MCGLFGIISKESVTVDKRALATLGFMNDVRGGDACGLFIDGQVEYGTEGDDVKFFHFFRKSELFKNATRANVVLGHCRKASVGGKSADKAQPIVIKENDEIKFVLLHNGTIKNYTELAKKYIPDENITGLSDTQVMAKIFYLSGFDCLEEYNGGAVFVVADYREETPKVYLWRGCSKDYSYSKEPTYERPLFIVRFNNRLAFSSIGEGLECLYPDLEVQTIQPNTLVSFENGKLHIVRKFDRSKCIQTPTTTYYGGGTAYGDDRDFYGDRSYAGTGSHWGGSGKVLYDSRKSKSQTGQETQRKETQAQVNMPSFRLDKRTNSIDFNVYTDTVYPDVNTLLFFVNKKGVTATGSMTTEFDPSRAALMHGIYRVSSLGYIRPDDFTHTPGAAQSDMFAFYQGRLLFNPDCYFFLQKIARLWCVDFESLYSLAPYLVDALSVYPHIKEKDGVANMFFTTNPDKDFDEERFSGEVPLLFTSQTRRITNGIIGSTASTFSNYQEIYSAVHNRCVEYKLDNKSITNFLNSND